MADAATTALLVTVAVLAPLPFGSVLPASRTLLSVLTLAALVAAACAGGAECLRPGLRPATAIAAVGVLGLLQALPWPRALTGLLAPGVAEAFDQGAGLVGSPPIGSGLVATLSISPASTLRAAALWGVAAAALLAATVAGASRRNRRVLGLALLVVALFEIVYGADNWFRGGARIWGQVVPGDPGRLRGTFVNPDHLAFFLEPAVVACFAWLWWAVRRLGRGGSLDRALLSTTLPALAFVMTFVGLAFTGSRAGMMAAALGLVAQAAILGWRRRWQTAILGLGALVLGGGGLLLFGLQEGMGRWMSTSAYEIAWGARMRLYGATLRLWLESPLLGSGLGTFREAYPKVQTANLDLAWHHAHSDLLELLATTGVVGLALVGLGVVAFTRRLVLVTANGKRSEERAAGLAALGALVAAAVHSCLDFGLAMPSNAVVLPIVLGLALGCPVMSDEERRALARRPRPRRGDQPVPPGNAGEDEGRSETTPGTA